ncbi:MAG: TIGR04282 family arsenosugar biosynthesis glycosyltransferase [Alteromonadaceae bacterium]|nr:TIGR04282 family arsenosugar biosynthesis glycosyltransferase [Alteromonadaceae bacterium]
MSSETRIIIIAKEPRPGFAKTRLMPALGAAGAAQLAEHMLRHTLAEARKAALGPVELCVAPEVNAPFWQALISAGQAELSQQADGDLGQKMERASGQGLAKGSPVILIGTDCPDLNANQLRTMAASLNTHHACLCPVLDGGYSLLGLTRPAPELFHDMPWSTSQVAALTRQRLRGLGWRWYESAPLSDIDEPEDLQYLSQYFPTLLSAHSPTASRKTTGATP